jgi:acetyl-CoA carboxylase carboxyl transferase subunit beta
MIFDEGKFAELDAAMSSGDPLGFVDTKKYTDRVKGTQKATGLKDAIRTAIGTIDGQPLVVASMDFGFIGGSMGSVMGEKISRAILKAIEARAAFMIISKSGGARMMEAGYSLMQMAKVSGNLGLLSEAKLPYISYLTDPTTGGVTASFAMLGDINIAEPGALIGFAGPRVVKETIGRDLPDGFQTSEFLLEHGFLDFIIDRTEIRPRLSQAIRLFTH